MAVTVQLVKELREISGAGMLECKKALDECGGDSEKALEHLRKQGLKASASKQARIAADGIVAISLAPDGKAAAMIEANCETDFVAKNEEFQAFAKKVADVILQKKPSSVEELLTLASLPSEKISEKLNLLVAKIGEKLGLRRFVRLECGVSEKLGSYVHLGSKIGVLIKLKGVQIEDSLIKDLAMHVAASHPLYLKKEEIPGEVIEKEKGIYREQLKDSGKPVPMLEKILEGKLSKFASEICLSDQVFIKDPSGKQTIAQLLKSLDPSLQIAVFVRYQVGEGMEKKSDDFAAEVSKMAAK